MTVIGIIPARYGSTRFPGKPLVEINGKPMIQRVYEQAAKALENVWVATDDSRISDLVKKFGGSAVMTSVMHKSGTDRCAEAVKIITAGTKTKFDVVINIQGDEPFIDPEQLKTVIKCFKNKCIQIATLVKRIYSYQELNDENKIKVVFNKNKEAIYFSRLPIPFLRNKEDFDITGGHLFYKHIGIYAYKIEVLEKISKLEPSPLERAESLEQLRWIENGFRINVEITDIESRSVDTIEDIKGLA